MILTVQSVRLRQTLKKGLPQVACDGPVAGKFWSICFDIWRVRLRPYIGKIYDLAVLKAQNVANAAPGAAARSLRHCAAAGLPKRTRQGRAGRIPKWAGSDGGTNRLPIRKAD